MKELFKKFIDSLSQKLENENFVVNYVSDFSCEFKNDVNRYDVKYISPCLILEKNEKSICEWFFNEQSVSKDIESISSDFASSILEKNISNKKFKEDEVSKHGDKKIDFNKMINKVLQFFPDLRNEFEQFDSEITLREKIFFTKKKVLPQMNRMIGRTKDENKVNRMFNNLCNDYVFGDDQVRCIVTMLFFNGIEGKTNRAKVRSLLPDYMKKTWDASWRAKKVLTF